MTATISLEVEESVLLIGLNRPNKLNAFDLAMLEELAAAYERLADDPRLRVGVVFGHGDHFTAGLDLSDVAPRTLERGPRVLAGSRRIDPLGLWGEPVPKPIVLAVHGYALTLAIELALAADVVVAADDVRFRQLEVGRGIMPYGGASFRGPSQLGWGNAMRFILTAQEFGAEEALRIGLVQEVVPVGRERDRAIEIARVIARQAPLAVQGALANARAARAAAEVAGIKHLETILPPILRSHDAAEGLASFAERRPGRFEGR